MCPYFYNYQGYGDTYRPDGFPGGLFPGGFPGGGGMFPGGGGQFPGGLTPGGQQPGGGQGTGMPSGPPPAIMPPKPLTAQGPSLYAVDPGAIRLCLFRFTAIYPSFGHPFWAWLVFVGPRSAAGYRWNGFFWSPFGIDLNQIDYFQCI